MSTFHLLSIIILLMSITCIRLPQTQPFPITKPGCPSKCGNITIPFPFGIGGSCSIDESFTIECNATQKPFIKSNGLEVLHISLDENTIRVNHPIYSSCTLIGYNRGRLSNMDVSPFDYNDTANKFYGVGPSSMSVFGDNVTIFGACMAMCIDNATMVTTACNGIGCCQTGLPSHLRKFSVLAGDLLLHCKAKCWYAFLVEQQWFVSTINYPLLEIPKMTHVPVILNWGLSDRMLAAYRKSKPKGTSYALTSRCGAPKNYGIIEILHCSCNLGYEGNPYLLQGCQDIDECIDSNNSVCPSSTICQNLPGTYSCYNNDHKRSPVSTILADIGAALGPVLLLFGGWWLKKIWMKRKILKLKEKNFKRNGGLLLQKQLSSTESNVDHIKIFSSKELEKATDNFNIVRKLGGGGQGAVYKGMLSNGRIVAVKRSKEVDERKVREFINEVFILSQISHRNVVRLLGCCLETEVPLLVYEFISNGTLYEYLHNQNDEFPLTWERRLQIAIEVAGALSYLHSAAALPIYHRDIKTSNILLDEKYISKIADFGISKSVNIDQSHVTTTVQGTFGYLDPEYFQSNQFTEKSDVYSFGVVLVELLTGKKLASPTISDGSPGLVTFFMESTEKDNLFNLLDAQVAKHRFKEDVMTMANLAVRCLSLNGKKRPTMKEVAQELEKNVSSRTDLSSTILIHYEEVYEDMDNGTSNTWSFASDTTGSSSVDSLCSLPNQKLLFR